MNLTARNHGGQALTAVPLRMSRLLDQFLEPWNPSPAGESWFPPMDVIETDTSIEVLVDLPGLDPENVDVSIRNDRLVISGSRPAPSTDGDVRWYQFERHAGDFRRSFTLPVAVDTDKAKATTTHGLLRIVLPKAAGVLPKRLTIKGS